MLQDHIKNLSGSKSLLHPFFQKSLDWIINNQDKDPGEYEINYRDLFAIIMEKTTRPRQDVFYEAHKNYIDLHYCVQGQEIIEWAPVNSLAIKEKYNPDKDVALYQLPDKATSLLMTRGTFAIFFPPDAHLPELNVKTSPQPLTKIVIKIHVPLS